MNARLKNAVVDAIIAKICLPDENRIHWYPTMTAIDIIYKGTPKGSHGRSLMVHIYTRRGLNEWLEDDVDPDFLLGCTRAFLELNQKHQLYVEIFDREVCAFHEHFGEGCCGVGGAKKRKREGEDEKNE